MKCAAELIAIKQIAEAEYQAEEHKKDMEALLAFQQMKENAVRFCETTINSAMTEKAQNRDPLFMTFKVDINKDRLGNRFFYCVVRDEKHTYANGDPAYRIDTSIKYSLDTLIDYLKDHCFEVDYNNYSFFTLYGCGNQRCSKINVYVKKPDWMAK